MTALNGRISTLGSPYRCVGCFEYRDKCKRTTAVCAKGWVVSRQYPWVRVMPAIEQMGYGRYVYAFRDTLGGLVKIGVSHDPYLRMRTYQQWYGSWLQMAAMTKGTLKGERYLHRIFGKHQQIGEWFVEAPEITAWIDEHRHAVAPRLVNAA